MFVMKEFHDPLCESQTANKEGMLRDASPTVEFKSTPKMKRVFRENCTVLQSYGQASALILHLLK